MSRSILCLLYFLLPTLTAFAQASTDSWEDAFHQWTEAEDVETTGWEEMFDRLQEMADHPLNLNEATREELEQLPFLTDQQVEQLLEYVYRYGPVRSLSELQMLTAFEPARRHLLSYFVYIGQPSAAPIRLCLDSLLHHGRQQLTATAAVPLYQRKGDRNGYLGYRYAHSVRYQFSYHDRVKFGLTGGQDAGEPFFSNRNTLGYDHYSYYIQLRNKGRIETLCLGMYQVRLGMGLLMNSGFQLGKLATLQSMGRSTTTLRAHTSRSTEGYLQGAAATVRVGRLWRATAFVSYRPLDATLNKDSTARTLLSSSYHRTPTEMEKKNNTHQWDVGGSVGWRKGTLYVNGNVVYTRLDRQLRPEKEKTVYRRYAAEGNGFLNVSADYGYTNATLSFSGETAINRQGALAAIHRLSWRLSDELTVMALHRYYDRRYTTLHGQSFSEGTAVQNEHGLYAGLTWQPSRKLTLYGYADYAHFAWPRYQVSASSDAFDAMVSTRYAHNQWTVEGRYRLHIRQRDNQEKTRLINRTEQRMRLLVGYDLPGGLSLKTEADGIWLAYRQHERGWMLSEQVAWQWRWLRMSGNVGYFHTDSYESRLYQYERDVRYAFSFPMYYGEGLRYAVMAQATVGRRLTAVLKLGVTDYFDRSVISSGLQQIDGSSKADLHAQVIWKF